jgi:hypothetical protein
VNQRLSVTDVKFLRLATCHTGNIIERCLGTVMQVEGKDLDFLLFEFGTLLSVVRRQNATCNETSIFEVAGVDCKALELLTLALMVRWSISDEQDTSGLLRGVIISMV